MRPDPVASSWPIFWMCPFRWIYQSDALLFCIIKAENLVYHHVNMAVEEHSICSATKVNCDTVIAPSRSLNVKT
jgi:hypothetical protein